jgi:hypothetical protein
MSKCSFTLACGRVAVKAASRSDMPTFQIFGVKDGMVARRRLYFTEAEALDAAGISEGRRTHRNDVEGTPIL